MNFLKILLVASITLTLACGKKSKNDDSPSPVPPVNNGKIPRWEAVDRKELKFNYYITNIETAFQLADENVGVVAVQPWLKLKGAENEPMDFVMMFEAAAPESCKQYQENKTFSWKGLVFDSYPDNQVVLFEETDRVLNSGKHQSIIHFLILKNSGGTCAKLTYYDINLKGYDHKLSVFDKSELSDAIRKIAASVRLK